MNVHNQVTSDRPIHRLRFLTGGFLIKSHRFTRLASPQTATLAATVAAPIGLAVSGGADASVMVGFALTPNDSVGNFLNLEFTVATNGTVTLDATGQDTSAAPTYDQLDGVVGSVSGTAPTEFTFTIVITGSNLGGAGSQGVNLRSTGLGISGSSNQQINWALFNDGTPRPVSQTSTFAVDISGVDPTLQFIFEGITTSDGTTGTQPEVVGFDSTAINLALDGPTDLTSATGLTLDGETTGDLTFKVASPPAQDGGALGFGIGSITFDIALVPAPGSLALGSCGLALMFARRR